jgi:predicted XRE-type DNA-binding protein
VDLHSIEPRLHLLVRLIIDLLRGRIDLFSTDALIDMLACLGATVRLTVKVRRAA